MNTKLMKSTERAIGVATISDQLRQRIVRHLESLRDV